jgi:hypothetical protein
MTRRGYRPAVRGRRGMVLIAIAVAAVAGAACGDDDAGGDTLAPIGSAGDGAAITVGTVTDASGTDGTAVDPALAGAGFVAITVRTPGIDETISLDRATVNAADLDPISLNATCTGLDGGTGVEVAVVDLRRLGSGAQLVSASLRAEGDVVAGGEFEGTLDLGGVDQATTSYTGAVSVLPGGLSGGFTVTDAGGNVATGEYQCANEPMAPPSSLPAGTGGEETPETTG